jgi:tetratricopeptide (TPR) repeat protein
MGVIALDTNDFARAAAVAGDLSGDEQEALSGVVFKALTAMDEYDTGKFERLYRLVIDACPATDRAHEAHWRLTHMYQQAFDPPPHEKIAALLEGFLARYKESKVVSMEKYPDEMLVFSPLRSLHQSYEALKQWDKIAAYYEKAVAEKKPMKPQDHFDYAKALDEMGKKAGAMEWYEKFIKVETDKDSFTVELATDRVKELKGQ